MRYNETDVALKIRNDLHNGDSFKSTADLFRFLGIPECKGNSYKSCMKMLERYIVINKDEDSKSRSITVTVRDEILPSSDGRHNPAISNQREFEILLADFLREQEKDRKSDNLTTQKTLFRSFCCHNSRYIKESKKESYKPYTYAWNLFNRSLSKCSRYYVINRLEKYAERGQIAFYKVIRADGKIYTENDKKYFEILEVEDEVMEELGYTERQKIIFSKDRDKYFRLSQERVFENLDISGYYRLYHLSGIDFDVDYTDEELKAAREAYRLMIATKIKIRAAHHRENKAIKDAVKKAELKARFAEENRLTAEEAEAILSENDSDFAEIEEGGYLKIDEWIEKYVSVPDGGDDSKKTGTDKLSEPTDDEDGTEDTDNRDNKGTPVITGDEYFSDNYEPRKTPLQEAMDMITD